jgi:hypothetical protein
VDLVSFKGLECDAGIIVFHMGLTFLHQDEVASNLLMKFNLSYCLHGLRFFKWLLVLCYVGLYIDNWMLLCQAFNLIYVYPGS